MHGEPNPRQWEMYAANNACTSTSCRVVPVHAQLEPRYMQWAQRVRIRRYTDPVVIQ